MVGVQEACFATRNEYVLALNPDKMAPLPAGAGAVVPVRAVGTLALVGTFAHTAAR